MPEDRNVGYYLRPLGKHALLIVLLVVLACLGAVTMWLMTQSSLPYVGESLIIFKLSDTGSVDISQAQQPPNTVDIPRQQKNVTLLAMSSDVAEKVKESAKTSNDPEVRKFADESSVDLTDRITVVVKGDFVSVQAKAATADAATWLANEWAEAAVAKVNTTFASPSPNVDEALTQVKSQLDKDQAALRQFLTSNQLNSAQQELSQTVEFIDAVVGSNARNNVTVYDAERNSIRDQISENYRTATGLDEQLSEMRALRSRINEGPDDAATLASNQVTLLTLWNQVVSGSSSRSASDTNSSDTNSSGVITTNANSGSQIQLQINLSDLAKGTLSKAGQLSNIDATISAVQKLQTDIRSQTTQLQSKLSDITSVATPDPLTSLPPLVQQYVQHQNQLQSQVEQLTFEQNRLTNTRNLDQKTYDLLRSRLAEQQVNQVISGIVDVGSTASVEATARGRSVIKALAVSVVEWGLIALALGVMLAYLLFLIRPQLNSNRVITGAFGRSSSKRRADAERVARVSSDG